MTSKYALQRNGIHVESVGEKILAQNWTHHQTQTIETLSEHTNVQMIFTALLTSIVNIVALPCTCTSYLLHFIIDKKDYEG
jgi:hypothetical protein